MVMFSRQIGNQSNKFKQVFSWTVKFEDLLLILAGFNSSLVLILVSAHQHLISATQSQNAAARCAQDPATPVPSIWSLISGCLRSMQVTYFRFLPIWHPFPSLCSKASIDKMLQKII